MPRRLFFLCAFWLGSFAVLMMHLGPLISGVQGVLSPEKSFLQQMAVEHVPGHEYIHVHESDANTHAGHHDHHAMMGHMTNPHLPDWVNNLKMCGYCELLTLSPALMLVLLFILLTPPKVRPIRRYLAAVHISVLQPHASPRAPPFLA